MKQPKNSNVPDIWPGAFGIYAYSKRAVEFNAGAFVPLILISYFLDLIASFGSNELVKILLYIAIFLLELAGYYVLLDALKNKKMSISEALDKGTRISIKVLALYILIMFAVVIGFICLIIPGLLILPRLVMAPFYMLDQNLGIKESIEASWKNTEGHSLKVWGVLAVEILFAVLTLILIGIYFSIIYAAAIVILYRYVNANPLPKKE